MTVTGGAGGEGASVPVGPEHQPGTLAPPGPEPVAGASQEPGPAAPAAGGPGAATLPAPEPGPQTAAGRSTAPSPPGTGPPGLDASARLSLPWALAVALTGGLALTAAFPPIGIWPLAPAGPALLAVALWRRGLRASLLAGLVFGLAFFVPLLSWLVNVAWYAWLALAVAEAVIFAVLAMGQRLLLDLRAWPLAVAGWWVCAEALRSRWPYAFPWGRLAMSQAGTPAAPWAAVGGAPLLSFLVALAGTTLAWALLVPGRRAGLRRRALPLLAFAGAAGFALAGALLPVDQQPPGTPTAVVAAVQGNVPHARSLPGLLRASTVTVNHAAATERLATRVRAGALPAPALVIWPENSTDLDPRYYSQVYATIAGAVNAIHRPVLVGTLLANPVRNAGVLWLPGRGPGQTYVKRQLVTFGEYIPFRGLLKHITSLVNLQPQNFTAGHRAVVFRAGKIRLGDVICYEVGFDGLVSSEVNAGANLLAVQTNDATFEVDGQRGETLQQLAMARIRAVESNRAVVVASTTGVSAIIAPDGRLIAHSGTWQRAVLEARVPLVSQRTLADRIGAWPQAVIVVLTLAALAWATAAALRRRRTAAR
ncbi:MAG TPA: apolipoprotein N-acyltransferase [Streptosporangiaceae bacterium]|nr:apolipoprotein N-acyltransferase [Streptosporangiaceae bacterium]